MVGDHQNDNNNNHQRHRRRSTSKSSTLKGYGEIVEVEGGHIVRSTGRKDRHSKVCTSKGPRDRRVRLSAHTAIQFYDVQDRLGFDRPSKAVDWLMKNAKAAIDELAKLPPWDPKSDPTVSSQEQTLDPDRSDSVPYDFGGSSSTSFLPPSLDSDSIADTIKSFFPVTDAMDSSSKSPIGVHLQDLRLSLQSIHDPILLHHHHQQQQHHGQSNDGEKPFFSTTNTPLVCDIIPFAPWAHAADGGGSGGGYACNFPSPPSMLPLGVPIHTISGQSSFFSQREPLQSSDSQSSRPWMDPVNTGFASGGFSGFRIPARIQGQDEHDGVSENLPSAPRH